MVNDVTTQTKVKAKEEEKETIFFISLFKMTRSVVFVIALIVGFVSASADIGDASLPMRLYIVHHETHELAELQGRSILQFMATPTLVYFVSTSCSDEELGKLVKVANALNTNGNFRESGFPHNKAGIFFSALKVPFYQWSIETKIKKSSCDEAKEFSMKEGLAYNWIVHYHLFSGKEPLPRYFGLAHSDMYLVSSWDVTGYLDARGVFGSPATYRQHGAWHLHPQLIFFRLDHWPQLNETDFSPGNKMDTGGGMVTNMDLGPIGPWIIPKRHVRMFEHLNFLESKRMSAVDKAIRNGTGEYAKSTGVEKLRGENNLYELFDNAWVHARHAKLRRLVGFPGLDTSKEVAGPWSIFKNAYMKGLIESRLWMCAGHQLGNVTQPSGSRLELDGKTIERGTAKLWSIAISNPAEMLLQDNAYLKGFVDATIRFWGINTEQTVFDFSSFSQLVMTTDMSVYVNTRPAGSGFC